MIVDIKLDSYTYSNTYGPNKDSPSFYNNILYIIALDPLKGTYNYAYINNPNSRKAVLNMMPYFSLTDVYRDLHPDTHRNTQRRKTPLQQAGLDYYLASNTFLDLVHKFKILPGYRSDCNMIKLDISITMFKHRKGLWKLNTPLLNNQDYLTLINNSITDAIFHYALPVYNPDYLKRNEFEGIQLTINKN